ncbi:hypothetical protein [Ascidiimonas sp. W6]
MLTSLGMFITTIGLITQFIKPIIKINRMLALLNTNEELNLSKRI